MANNKFTIKYSSEKPPNWIALLKVFPTLKWEDGLIVTYGDTYYSIKPISDDFLAHEETHMRQQEAIGVEEWWSKYFADPIFRLHQEVEAYRNQLQFLLESYSYMARSERKFKMRKNIELFAQILSSDIYGNIIPYVKALELIKP